MEQKKEHIEKIAFYDTFTCIADKCPITCCQEWKIAVDDNTFAEWKKIAATTAELGTESQEDKMLSDFVTYKDDARVIALQSNMQCPFLNQKKLCRLVLEHGDEILSETCRIFPRQVNTYDESHKGYALMASCPAVIDLLQQQPCVTILQNLEEPVQKPLTVIRNMLCSLVQKNDFTLEETLQIGFIILLELFEQLENETQFMQIVEQCADERYQQKIVKSIRKMKFQPVYTFEECNELFLDLVENYRTQGIYKTYLEPMAELAEAYCEEDEDYIAEQIQLFLPQFIEYDSLCRKYLASEIFANFYLPEDEFEDVIQAYEWIAMEYATIRHAIFLQWSLQKRDITYELVRQAIVIIARMTGYDAEDLQEYIENSFEDSIWEWGYLALITGKR